jgi:hypothetical protein
MPKYLTITEAQQEMPKWPDDLAAEPAIITKDGKSELFISHFSSSAPRAPSAV